MNKFLLLISSMFLVTDVLNFHTFIEGTLQFALSFQKRLFCGILVKITEKFSIPSYTNSLNVRYL